VLQFIDFINLNDVLASSFKNFIKKLPHIDDFCEELEAGKIEEVIPEHVALPKV